MAAAGEMRLRPVPIAEARGLLAGRWSSAVPRHPEYPLADTLDALALLFRAYETVTGSAPAEIPAWWIHQIVCDGWVVGDIGYHGPPSEERPYAVEIGYAVVPACRGRGIATRACALLLEQAWRDGADLVQAETDPANRASQTVLRRNGFRVAGDGALAIARPS